MSAMKRSFLSSTTHFASSLRPRTSRPQAAMSVPLTQPHEQRSVSPLQATSSRPFSLLKMFTKKHASVLHTMLARKDPQTVDYFYKIPRENRSHEDWCAMIDFLAGNQQMGMLMQMLDNYFTQACNLPSIYLGKPVEWKRFQTRPIFTPGVEPTLLSVERMERVMVACSTPHAFKRRDRAPWTLFEYFRKYKFPIHPKMYNDLLLAAAANTDHDIIQKVMGVMKEDKIEATAETWRALLHHQLSLQHKAKNKEEKVRALVSGERIFQNMIQSGAVSDMGFTVMLLLCTSCSNLQKFELYEEKIVTEKIPVNPITRAALAFGHLKFAHEAAISEDAVQQALAMKHFDVAIKVLREAIQAKDVIPQTVEAFFEYFLNTNDPSSSDAIFSTFFSHNPSVTALTIPTETIPLAMEALEAAGIQRGPIGLPASVMEDVKAGLADAAAPLALPVPQLTALTTLVHSYSQAMKRMAELLRARQAPVDLNANFTAQDILQELCPTKAASILAAIPKDSSENDLYNSLCLALVPIAAKGDLSSKLTQAIWLYSYDRVQALYQYSHSLPDKTRRPFVTALAGAIASAPPAIMDGHKTDEWQVRKALDLLKTSYCEGVDLDIRQVNVLIENAKTLHELHFLIVTLDKMFAPSDLSTYNAFVDKLGSISGSRSLVYNWFTSKKIHLDGNPKFLETVVNFENDYAYNLLQTFVTRMLEESSPQSNCVADPEILPEKIINSRIERCTATFPHGASLSQAELLGAFNPTGSNRFLNFMHALSKITPNSYGILLRTIASATVMDQRDIEVANFAVTEICNYNSKGLKPQPTPLMTFKRLLNAPNLDLNALYEECILKSAPYHILTYIELMHNYNKSLDDTLIEKDPTHPSGMTSTQRAKPSLIRAEYLQQLINNCLFVISTLGFDRNFAVAKVLLGRLQMQKPVKIACDDVFAKIEGGDALAAFVKNYQGGETTDPLYAEAIKKLNSFVTSFQASTSHPSSEVLLELYSPSLTDDAFVNAQSTTKSQHGDYATRDGRGLADKNLRLPYNFPKGFFLPTFQEKRNNVAAMLMGLYVQLDDEMQSSKKTVYAPNAAVGLLLSNTKVIVEVAPFSKIKLDYTRVPRMVDM